MRDNDGWTDDMNDATPDWEAEQEYLAGLRTLDDPWPGEESPESDNYDGTDFATGTTRLVVGEWMPQIEGEPILCERGYHVSDERRLFEVEIDEVVPYMHRLLGVLLGAFAVHTIIMGTLLLLMCSE